MKTINKTIKKLITHNGAIHTDDIFAAAALSIFLENSGKSFKIIRSRDKDTIGNGDYVFDVGEIYNPELNRFDHHQKGGAGKRENGIPYSSFGLIWKHFGVKICSDDEDVWSIIESKIVIPIDATDNGFDIAVSKFKGVMPYDVNQIFSIFSPTWQEDQSDTDKIFISVVKYAVKILRREIEVAKSDSLGKKLIEESYRRSSNKQIVELTTFGFSRYLYQKILSAFSEPIYVVYKSKHSDIWKVEAIQKSFDTLESRKLFPESWRGLFNGDRELKRVTSVDDVIFCHRDGFLVEAKSKEGAIKLAKIALES